MSYKMPQTPEEKAREQIDQLLTAAGWSVQDYASLDLTAGAGIAVREFPLAAGHGTADYLLYANKKLLGVIEAKKEGDTLTGVEVQSEKYASGLPLMPIFHSITHWIAIRTSICVMKHYGVGRLSRIRRDCVQ